MICDVNFPAAEVASKTTTGKHIMLAGCDLVETLDAICSVCPLDAFVDCAAVHMNPADGDGPLPPLGQVRKRRERRERRERRGRGREGEIGG